MALKKSIASCIIFEPYLSFNLSIPEATAFINDGENILNSVTCLLDEYGNTVSSYKEANTGREFEASMELIDIMGELTGTSR